jgi:sulfur carrier protein ThiS
VTITVYLHTILQKQTAEGVLRSLELSVPEGSKVVDVLVRLEIKIDPDDVLITVNGQVTDESQVLFTGDRVDFIPAISGGS